MEKYVGCIIEIIYLGRDGSISQRKIEVKSVSLGVIKAYCLRHNAPRVFKVENILAVQPAERRTS